MPQLTQTFAEAEQGEVAQKAAEQFNTGDDLTQTFAEAEQGEVAQFGDDASGKFPEATKGSEYEPLEREAARERQGTRTDLQHSGKFPESSKGDALDRVAARLQSQRSVTITVYNPDIEAVMPVESIVAAMEL